MLVYTIHERNIPEEPPVDSATPIDILAVVPFDYRVCVIAVPK